MIQQNNNLRRPWLFVAVTALCLMLRPTDGFASRRFFGSSRTAGPSYGQLRPTNTSRRHATCEFKGESSTSIDIPLASSTNTKTLPEWLLSNESDPFFLATEEYAPRSDGAWDAFQPSVDWFGLELVPVFVISLQRTATSVSSLITEAKSDIRSGQDSVRGRLVSGIMEKSTFRGGNTVAWQETKSGDGWTLQADLSLTVSIPLPRFLPLPPGFNSIGSRVVQSTCKSRLEKFAVDLQEAYLDWARVPQEKEG